MYFTTTVQNTAPEALAELHHTSEFSPNTEEGLEIIYLLLWFANYNWESEIQLADRGEERAKSHSREMDKSNTEFPP